MKKVIGIVAICLFLVGCQPKVDKESLPLINGYWEIERVVFDQGSAKEYATNESYDYFELKDLNGFRMKVMPQLNGTFETNAIREKIKIREKEGQFYIDFKTNYAKWTELILCLDANKLVLKNSENNEYHYKKAQPIAIIPNEKAIK